MQFKRFQDGFDFSVCSINLTDTSADIPTTSDTAPLLTDFGRDLPATEFATAYAAAVEHVQEAADTHESVILMPDRFSLLRSAKAISDFLEKVDRDNVSVLLAPGELIINSSEDEMFYALDDKIAGLYATDIDIASMEGAVLGDGDVSWTTILSLYHEHCEDLPIYLPDNDRFDTDCRFLEKLDEVARRMLG